VLSIALDEQKEDDEAVEVAGFKVLIDSDLASNLNNVEIDYSNKWYSKGFTVESNISSSC